MAFFSNADIPVAFEVLAWAQSFLAEPHSMMKRPAQTEGGVVCPFIKAVLDENALYMAFHHEVNGKSAELIESIVLGYREPFKKSSPFHESERLKKSLLIIFPEIPVRETGVLDIVQANIKTACVQDGLMVTQCHARCDGRSVHNPALKVYQSPYPLFAMRHMALHDIVFLPDNGLWFAAYDLRFGARFREPEKLEDFERPLLDCYRRAKARLLP